MNTSEIDWIELLKKQMPKFAAECTGTEARIVYEAIATRYLQRRLRMGADTTTHINTDGDVCTDKGQVIVARCGGLPQTILESSLDYDSGVTAEMVKDIVCSPASISPLEGDG